MDEARRHSDDKSRGACEVVDPVLIRWTFHFSRLIDTPQVDTNQAELVLLVWAQPAHQLVELAWCEVVFGPRLDVNGPSFFNFADEGDDPGGLGEEGGCWRRRRCHCRSWRDRHSRLKLHCAVLKEIRKPVKRSDGIKCGAGKRSRENKVR